MLIVIGFVIIAIILLVSRLELIGKISDLFSIISIWWNGMDDVIQILILLVVIGVIVLFVKAYSKVKKGDI